MKPLDTWTANLVSHYPPTHLSLQLTRESGQWVPRLERMVTSRNLHPFEKNILLTLIGFVIQPNKVHVYTCTCMYVWTYYSHSVRNLYMYIHCTSCLHVCVQCLFSTASNGCPTEARTMYMYSYGAYSKGVFLQEECSVLHRIQCFLQYHPTAWQCVMLGTQCTGNTQHVELRGIYYSSLQC